jgi:hypothetical protein
MTAAMPKNIAVATKRILPPFTKRQKRIQASSNKISLLGKDDAPYIKNAGKIVINSADNSDKLVSFVIFINKLNDIKIIAEYIIPLDINISVCGGTPQLDTRDREAMNICHKGKCTYDSKTSVTLPSAKRL